MHLGRVVAIGCDPRRALELAAAAAFGSIHPLAMALSSVSVVGNALTLGSIDESS